MPKVKLKDVDLYYRIEGKGEPLLLIHGLGGDHTSFEGPLKLHLLERFKIITMDLRGHGRSSRPRPEYTTRLFARDVKRLMDTLRIPAASVLGISMGGATAMCLAADYPSRVTRLVLVDTWAKCDEAAKACFLEWIEASWESRRVLQKIVLIRTATSEFLSANPEFLDLFEETWPVNFAHAFRKSCMACISHDATGVLGKIKSPTLIMVGDRDILVPPRFAKQLSKGIKNSRLRIIRGGGHVPWLDNPQACIKHLAAFLA